MLELYALGLTNEEQNAEISELLQNYPELRKELQDIQNSLERFASNYSEPMPDDLKQMIMTKIRNEKIDSTDIKNTNIRFLRFFNYLALAVLMLGILYLWNQNDRINNELKENQKQIEQLYIQQQQDSLALADCNEQLLELKNKDQFRILLKGTSKSPQSFAAIYYDTLSQRTILDVMNLPVPPAHKQYQLWAIVGGKPMDLGVFDLALNKNTVREIRFISDAQAFAITLEPEGGLPSPSLDEMYVLGSL